MNYHVTYKAEVIPTEAGEYYARLLEKDSGRQLWESRLYDEPEEAWDAVLYEWDARAEQDREEVQRQKRLAEDGAGVSEQQRCQENGVPWCGR